MAESPSVAVRDYVAVANSVNATNQCVAPNIWRRVFGLASAVTGAVDMARSQTAPTPDQDAESKQGLIRRMSRKVVPGLPRTQTFKRQQSESRTKMKAIEPSLAERRAVSMDRRLIHSRDRSRTQPETRISAPNISSIDSGTLGKIPTIMGKGFESAQFHRLPADTLIPQDSSLPSNAAMENRAPSTADAVSANSQLDPIIYKELKRNWILNLSMYFRDKSKREKFFVTYRDQDDAWRRVTISLDYRNAPSDSLESELARTRLQRDKIAKIYESIRDSLEDIQFYPTVTNLKLQTTDGRLHVHVVEDVNVSSPAPIAFSCSC